MKSISVNMIVLFLLCTKWMDETSAEDQPRATTGCDEKDIALTALASIAVMKSNGWEFDFTDADANHNSVGQQCFSNGEKAKWFGFSAGNAVGTLSATFTGHGEATVDFGNCWYAGNVKLYLDSTLIATAPVGTKSKIAEFVFTPGSVLKLKDEDGNAVVMLNSVSVNCDSGDPTIEGVLSLSSEQSSRFPTSNCLDGDVNTFCHTANEKYPYIVMEYPQEVLIKKVKVVARNNVNAARVKQLVVSVTNVKPTVGKLVSGGKTMGTFAGPASAAQEIIFTSEAGLRGKYVVIQQGYTGYINYAEIEITILEPAIAYKLTDAYDLIWRDFGTGGKYDVAIWQPKNYQSEFCFLGDVATNGYNPPLQASIVVSALKSGALVHPSSFSRVWTDSGSGATWNCAVYKMNAPAGYTCLGGVAMRSHSAQPDRNKYCCVKNDYIVSGEVEFVYNDKGTGADAYLSLWTVKRGMDVYGFDGGNFVPVNGHGKPSHGYLLKGDEVTVKSAWTIEVKETKPLKLYEVSELKEVWNDGGSGAKSDVSIWRTEVKDGYYSLGDMAVNSRGKPSKGFLLKPSNPKDNDAVKTPNSYSPIWNSKGSGADRDVTIWRVNCPGGYVALGNVATYGTKPALGSIACVNSKYVERGYNNGNSWKLIWNDYGSGADIDVSIFEAKGARKTQQTVRGIGAITSWGYYPGTPYLLKKSGLTYSSEKPIERIEMSNVQYNLKAQIRLPSTPTSLTSITVTNDLPTEQTSSQTISYEASETSSFTFEQSIELGVELMIEAGFPLIGGSETTISVKSTSTFNTGKSTTTTTSESVIAEVRTPAYSRIRATVVGNRYTADIPYTAHIKKIYYDGTEGEADITGIYHGVSVSEVWVTYGNPKPKKI